MKDIKFARTMWANIQLAKLCPNNDINRLGDVVSTNDFVAQVDTMMSIIQILNESYERKAHFEDDSHEVDIITREELENLNEAELTLLVNKAFEVFGIDGETTVETVPEKTKKEVSPSS